MLNMVILDTIFSVVLAIMVFVANPMELHGGNSLVEI